MCVCPCVCVQELPPAAHACARTRAARGGSAAPSPKEIMKEGLKVPSQWQPARGQSPAAIPFLIRSQAWHCCRPKPGLQGRGASVSQELPQSRAPGGAGNSGDSPGSGRPHTPRQVLAAAMAQPEGGWCLSIYLRTEVWLSISGFVLKAASCWAASAWGGGVGRIPGLLVPMCSGIAIETDFVQGDPNPCLGTPESVAPSACPPPLSVC